MDITAVVGIVLLAALGSTATALAQDDPDLPAPPAATHDSLAPAYPALRRSPHPRSHATPAARLMQTSQSSQSNGIRQADAQLQIHRSGNLTHYSGYDRDGNYYFRTCHPQGCN
jgi:hypothetical protein